MKNSVKILLSLGLVTTLGTGGTVLIANAQNKAVSTPRDAHIAQSAAREANESPENEAEDTNEGQEIVQYEALATITANQAKQTAETAQGATAIEVELDEEDGSLIYEVEFADETEVYIDAGNGEILKTELPGEEADDATETPLRSSIQIPTEANEPEEHEN